MTTQFDIFTLFPHIFKTPFSESLLGKAKEKGLIHLNIYDIREYTTDKHKTADDVPYGGGPGMVMKPEPIFSAIESVCKNSPHKKRRRIYFSPQGRVLKQKYLNDYLAYDQLILLCGRYEGVDERVMEGCMDEEVSIGDYILSGGEFAALVFVDALVRLIPGVVGCEESLKDESFSRESLLEYPQYTRPPEFRGMKVPEVLLSGDHKKIEQWRQEQALLRTRTKRPDLMKMISKP